jgi:hypothetical protein
VDNYSYSLREVSPYVSGADTGGCAIDGSVTYSSSGLDASRQDSRTLLPRDGLRSDLETYQRRAMKVLRFLSVFFISMFALQIAMIATGASNSGANDESPVTTVKKVDFNLEVVADIE